MAGGEVWGRDVVATTTSVDTGCARSRAGYRGSRSFKDGGKVFEVEKVGGRRGE